MSERCVPSWFTESAYRRARVICWTWFAAFVAAIVVPLSLNGWNRPGLFDDDIWRSVFGGFLLLTGGVLIFCRRGYAAYMTLRESRSVVQRLQRRLLFRALREPGVHTYYGFLLGAIATGVLLIAAGVSFCADWFPHPRG